MCAHACVVVNVCMCVCLPLCLPHPSLPPPPLSSSLSLSVSLVRRPGWGQRAGGMSSCKGAERCFVRRDGGALGVWALEHELGPGGSAVRACMSV